MNDRNAGLASFLDRGQRPSGFIGGRQRLSTGEQAAIERACLLLPSHKPGERGREQTSPTRLAMELCLGETALAALTPKAALDLSMARIMEDEAEATSSPACRFVRDLSRGQYNGLEDFLHCAVGQYVAATRYLLPLLHNFSLFLQRLCRSSGRSVIYLCLRDGLAFLPALEANQDPAFPVAVRPLLYTRALKAAGCGPVVFDAAGGNACTPGGLNDGIIVDVGFYGSLVDTLLEKGYCTREQAWVMFLSSRNPNLAGFLNFCHAVDLACGDRGERDVIWVADIVESLFKPVRVTANGNLGWADPLAVACALSLQAALYRYAVRRHRRLADGCINCLDRGTNDPGAWWIAKAVPNSLDGQAFAAAWRWGVLHPQDRITGLFLA